MYTYAIRRQESGLDLFLAMGHVIVQIRPLILATQKGMFYKATYTRILVRASGLSHMGCMGRSDGDRYGIFSRYPALQSYSLWAVNGHTISSLPSGDYHTRL